MSKKHISQAELATICNCKQQYIGKLKKKSVFDHCLDGNKFLRSKTTEYIKIYEDNKDERYENQRQANDNKKNGTDEDENTPPVKPPQNPNNDIGMFDVSYLGDDAQRELDLLIITGKTAVQKIQIKDAFIESKRKENEFKKELGVLIELEQAEALIELVASNMKTKMYNLPHLLKSKYSKITKEQVNYVYDLVDLAFAEFHKYGIEADE